MPLFGRIRPVPIILMAGPISGFRSRRANTRLSSVNNAWISALFPLKRDVVETGNTIGSGISPSAIQGMPGNRG